MNDKLIGYIKIRAIYDALEYVVWNDLSLRENGFRNYSEFRHLINNSYLNLVFLKNNFPLYIDKFGNLKTDDIIMIGTDHRSVYAKYDHHLVKIAVITEWSKFPFVREENTSDIINQYKEINKVIDEKQQEINNLKNKKSYLRNKAKEFLNCFKKGGYGN